MEHLGRSKERGMTLRDYQVDAVEQIRALYREGKTRVLYTAPTGSGKTVVFSYITRRTTERQKRALILVHRRELLHQSARSLEVPFGLIQPGEPAVERFGFALDSLTDAMVQIAMVQTINRRIAKYQSAFDLIIIDEAHHATCDTYTNILDANPEARVLGVTATPCRLSGKPLGDLFQHLVLGPSVSDLTARGYLCRAEVYGPPQPMDLSGIRTHLGDWDKAGLADAVDKRSITGSAVDHYKRLAERLPAIAFCASVEHAHHVADEFRAAGYNAEPVDGKTDKDTRDARIAALARGDLNVLTSCDIISEGVDVPVVACGIMLRPTKSMALCLQQMGRILRPSPGKQRAIILDHAGNCLRHGLPETPREWSLTEKVKAKKQTDADPVRQCPECYFVHDPGPVCPECGYVYEVKPRALKKEDGDLERLQADTMWLVRRHEQGRAQTLEGLIAIGRDRGYGNPTYWAKCVLKGRRRRAGQ